MKKLISFILVLTLLLSFSIFNSNEALANDPINVRINGELQSFPTNQQPVILNSRTMLPMSIIYQRLGFNVTWNDAERKLTATLGNQSIVLWIDSTTAQINGSWVKLEVAPTIINNITYIPVYVVGLTKNASVGWNNHTRTVDIQDFNKLDYGIYWYGNGNVSQKFIAGQSNPYYSSSKPTVIYVHGWQKGTINDKFRESFHYQYTNGNTNVDLVTINSWISAGWNVGIFYWNQFADEDQVTDAEAKIWTPSGPRSMRWRKFDGTYVAGPAKSAAQLFYESYVQAMNGYTGTNIRIVGHSLGNQMAVRLSSMVNDNILAGNLPARLRPQRVALLDPFWSKDGKSYLNNEWTGQRSRTLVNQLITRGVAFEQYKSSGITDVGVGDTNVGMENMTAFSRLAPWYIPSHDMTNKHNMAPHWYFWSYAFNAPTECTVSWNGTRTATGNVAASAKTSDARIREMMGNQFEWVQVEGRDTPTPQDDWFERKTR